MKTRFPVAGTIAAVFFSANLSAQTGFQLLAPVPQTGQLQNQPSATQFCFVAAGDNRPAADGLPQPPVLTQIFNGRRDKGRPGCWARAPHRISCSA